MLTYILNGHLKPPLYEQLYRLIRADIEKNSLKAHEKMPSKRAIGAHLKISQSTVENVYAQLVAEGYLYTRPRRGYFVEALEPRLKAFSPTIPTHTIKKTAFQTSPPYDFQTNAVDIASFPLATWAKLSREILSESSRKLLQASHPQGDPDLRLELARYLHSYRGISCRPEQIIIGAGSEYLIGLIVQLLGRKAKYAIENPGYPKIRKIFNSNGARTTAVNLDENGLRLDLLEQSKADVVHVTPSHHFPLGIVMPISRRAQLLKWAGEKKERYILEDDYDSEFRFQGRPIPAMQSLDHQERIIYFNTFAKSLAPSSRLGYVVLPEPLLEKYQRNLNFYACTVSGFEQRILYQFLKGGYFERHLRRMRNIYKAKMDFLISQISHHDPQGKISISGQNAGLHLLLQIDNQMGEKELLRRALAGGVRLYGISDYFHHQAPGPGSNRVVLGYVGLAKDDLAEAVKRLVEAWGLFGR